MAPHSSTLAWKIPWAEEPSGLQSMGSQRVGHDWTTSLSLFTFMHWRRKWQPTAVFLPGESQGRGSLVGCHLWGRTESDTTEVTHLSSSKSKQLTGFSPFICLSAVLWTHLLSEANSLSFYSRSFLCKILAAFHDMGLWKWGMSPPSMFPRLFQIRTCIANICAPHCG